MQGTNVHGPQTAYLFQCRNDADLFAVSLNEEARNIPLGTAWYGGWCLRAAFALDADGAAPVDIDANSVRRGVRTIGYYIWRNGLR